ncbi:MAG: DUF4099 domain-containing protein [Pseudosphingobacterium sp.]|nr:DUF4099 domain-containing protein [Pseudosphingobacterium sp.]
MDNIFDRKDLPLSDLQKLGLYSGGDIHLEKEDLDALLAGRRTNMISLKDLKGEGVHIEQLDARLSLSRQPDGRISLNVHPIYKEAIQHPLLINSEAEQLIQGNLSNISKTHNGPLGTKTYIIEYDKDTREFVSYDPENVRAPDKVNGQPLSDAQKDRFRNGMPVDLEDGTRFQYRASERKGLLSNRTGLILSLLIDGGISYLVFNQLNNLLGNREKQKDAYSEGYNKALEEMKIGQRERERINDINIRNQQSRGYGRGTAR